MIKVYYNVKVVFHQSYSEILLLHFNELLEIYQKTLRLLYYLNQTQYHQLDSLL